MPVARNATAALPGAHAGIMAFTDFHGPYGVPDLTVLTGDGLLRRKRMRARVAPVLNEVDAGIVSAADPKRPQSARQIAYRLRWDLDTVHRRLPIVKRSGAIMTDDAGRITRHPAIEPIGNIFAIENKVRDWRGALRQCRNYRLWADGYVMVLAHAPESVLAVLTREVASDGGGLVVGGEAVLEVQVRTSRRSERLWASEHVVAELVARQRRRSYQPSVRP